MAKRHKAKIIILHSIEPIRHIHGEGASFRLEEMLKEAKDQDRKTDIEEIKKGLREFCKKAETQIGPSCAELVTKILVPLGHFVEEILKAADD